MIAGVLLLLAVILIPHHQYMRTITPPKQLVFSEIDTNKFHIVTANKTHFVVIPVAWNKTIWVNIVLPSGPPVCVYSTDGNLVEWTSDSGDHSAFLKRWEHLLKGVTKWHY